MSMALTVSKIVLDSDMREIMLAAYRDNTAAAVKKQLMLEILANTGIRVSELAGLRIADTPFSLGVNVIEVYKGKKGNCRNVAITDELAKKINDYIDSSRPKTLPRGLGKYNLKGWLFYDRSRHKYSRQAIAKMVDRVAKKAKIRKKITPHMFRHRYATVALSQGVDIVRIKSWLGHSSLAVTEKYLDVAYIFDSGANDGLSKLSKALTAHN